MLCFIENQFACLPFYFIIVHSKKVRHLEDINTLNSCNWLVIDKMIRSGLQIIIYELRAKNCTSYFKKMFNPENGYITICIKLSLEGHIWNPYSSFGGQTEYLCDILYIYYN